MKYLFVFLVALFLCRKTKFESNILKKINSFYYKDSTLAKKVFDDCGACLEYTVKLPL